MKSGMLRYPGHSCDEETRNAYKFLWGNVIENDHFETREEDGMITIKLIRGVGNVNWFSLAGFEFSAVCFRYQMLSCAFLHIAYAVQSPC
jgi:hypothetical protein